MNKRLKQLRINLGKAGRLPYVISDLKNIRYLTGFTGSAAMLIVTAGDAFFISDSRYEEYARSILPADVKFVLQSGDINLVIKELCRLVDAKELFVEDHLMPVSAFFELKKVLRGVKLSAGGNETNMLRMVKDDEEVAVLRQAAAITDKCVKHICSIVKPGMTEWELAVEIDLFYKKQGCRGTSFDTIVASGTFSSMPHYETSMTKKIKSGDVLLIDMGCEYQGYNSDLTRTFFIGSVDSKLRDIYNVVKEAGRIARESVKPGITAAELDGAARAFIEAAGFGDNFGHGLGHGYGLEIHELPSIRKNNDTVLKKNMTITIEPGIYVPGLGGVRIEDMVLVTASGGESLTKFSRELIVL